MSRLYWNQRLKNASRESETPLYRSYGVTKKWRTPAEIVGENLLAAIAFWLSGTLLLAALMAAVAFFLYGNILLVTLCYLLLAWIFLTVATRTVRKRRKFLRQLKKLCRKENYRLTWKRSFLRSFRWEEQTDFTLSTRTARYEVRFLSLYKYNASLFFDGEELRYVTYPLKNIFTTIFGFSPRQKVYPLPKAPSSDHAEHAIIMNPVCREMFLKDRDGSLIATGSGATFRGYSFYTASAFLETVRRRDAENAPRKEISF